MNNVQVVIGPPGTGKTTYLIGQVEEYLKKGVKPDEIAYISFTTKAATEAKTRAMEKFNFHSKDLPWFRTLHSMMFKWLNMTTTDLMKKSHYSEVCEKLGIEFSGYVVLEEGLALPGSMEGDRMLFNEGIARVRMISVEQQYNLSDENYSLQEFKRFCTTLEQYKETLGLIDFNDMLALGLQEKELPRFKVLFVDEAQDLSKLQWALVDRLIANSEVSYVAGDDDQAIFRWAGADPDSFINCRGSVKELTKSYRLSNEVHAAASGIIRHCSSRRSKSFSSAGHTGMVHYITHPDELDLSDGEWLVLARNAYLLNEVETHCEDSGFAFDSRKSPLRNEAIPAIRDYEAHRKGGTLDADQIKQIKKFYPGFDPLNASGIWHEEFTRVGQELKDYYVSILRRGESILKPPRIKLSTIHGAKGGEADNVVVFSDVSYRSYEEMQSNPDDEIRVFYVAATRAKKNLYIVEPKSLNAFNLW